MDAQEAPTPNCRLLSPMSDGAGVCWVAYISSSHALAKHSEDKQLLKIIVKTIGFPKFRDVFSSCLCN
ncbi:hypothetical protein CEXT_692041 [Caerostris extrusa]|uniref:Uncharacterized protein n=1 Tax=Caerostris extrusa TaxID=172846 RepID=A0AAV4WYY7_CAEEX|nr:hypothetical protein CEXT_692041 [Caerostris extrusa]